MHLHPDIPALRFWLLFGTLLVLSPLQAQPTLTSSGNYRQHETLPDGRIINPEAAGTFTGTIIGSVAWSHASGNWIAINPIEITASDGDAQPYAELLNSKLAVGVKWHGAGKPDAEQLAALAALERGGVYQFEVAPASHDKKTRRLELIALPAVPATIRPNAALPAAPHPQETKVTVSYLNSLLTGPLAGIEAKGWPIGLGDLEAHAKFKASNTNGAWLNSAAELSDGTPFPAKLSLNVLNITDVAWHAASQARYELDVLPKQKYILIFSYRAISVPDGSESIFDVNVRQFDRDNKSFIVENRQLHGKIGADWTQVVVPFATRAPGDVMIAFQCGYKAQILEIGGVALVRLDDNADIKALKERF